jgi:hypothetical protein
MYTVYFAGLDSSSAIAEIYIIHVGSWCKMKYSSRFETEHMYIYISRFPLSGGSSLQPTV